MSKTLDIKIPFNKPYLCGDELKFIQDAVNSKQLSGNGKYTKLCQEFFSDKFNFQHSLLTTSCTDALEMSSILIDTQEGDEIIMPSYTFVSTANAFVLRGAKIVFTDSMSYHPNMDASLIEEKITAKTKAIVCVHYAGVANDMDRIMKLAKKHNLYVIEDAAHCIDSWHNGQALGTFGDLATFSFHETKNISCGEGGLLVINNEDFVKRAEIIWEKGTNRSAFWRGEVDKYTWVDIGSSFLPSEVNAAFLYAQLMNYSDIQEKRVQIWKHYAEELAELADQGCFKLPILPSNTVTNGHLFYLITNTAQERTDLISHLKEHSIYATFHYLPLHKSKYYLSHGGEDMTLENVEFFAEHLIRLPLFYELSHEEQSFVIDKIKSFYA